MIVRKTYRFLSHSCFFDKQLSLYFLKSSAKLIYLEQLQTKRMFRSFNELPNKMNTWHKYLVAENVEAKSGDKILPRQVRNCHFTIVLPENVPNPNLVIASTDCAQSLGLQPEELQSPLFTRIFSGNERISGFDRPYSTIYGCHSYGQWFGQLGDGRAITLGEVINSEDPPNQEYVSDGIRELQLKGSGRSPYSRGFDGRAVLRSSIREFLGNILA